MKILSVYFSGTNSTKYFSNIIEKKVKEKNTEVVFENLDISAQVQSFDLKTLDEYDFYLIGGPVYAEAYPHFLDEFVRDNFKNGRGKKVAIYFTAAGDTPPVIYGLQKYLTKNGYEVVSGVGVAMINNFYMSGTFKYTDKDKRSEILKVASEKATKIAEVILGEKESYFACNNNKALYYVGKVMYSMLKNGYIKNYAKKRFSSSDKCTLCLKCVKNCPTKNIKEENKKLEFSNKCLTCMRCIHICPFNAIQYEGKDIQTMDWNTEKEMSL